MEQHRIAPLIHSNTSIVPWRQAHLPAHSPDQPLLYFLWEYFKHRVYADNA